MDSKGIVLINQVTGYLFIDISNAFAKRYDRVALICGTVHSMNIPLDKKIVVRKIPNYNKKSTFTRFVSWILGFVKTVILINIQYRNYEIFASSNPPLLNTLPLFCRNKISLLIYDVYPDGLVAGGFIKENGFISRVWSRLNKKAFPRFQTLSTVTNSMAELLSKYVEKEKIQVVPIWINQGVAERPATKKLSGFFNNYNLQGKFLVVYSGNLGMGYKLESLVNLAKNLQDQANISILIIGEGFKKEILQSLIDSNDLTNCLLLPYQDADIFVEILHAMHVGIVSIDSSASKLAIPSKTFNIIGAGKPLICLSTGESELSHLISYNRIGKTIAPEDEGLLKDFVLELVNNRSVYEEFSQNAFRTAENFTSVHAERLVMNHVQDVHL